MDNQKGIIYIRDNAWFRSENIIKLGITSSIKNRGGTYITGEPERGEFICVVEIPLMKMKLIDKCLKSYFHTHNIYRGGGTEFYKRCIVYLLEPYLKKTNLEYKILSQTEINDLNWTIKTQLATSRIKTIFQNHKLKILPHRPAIPPINPNEQQRYVLNMIESYYKTNKFGKIIWACGTGKSLLSVMIAHRLNCHTILYGVSSANLQVQLFKEIVKIFPNIANILFVGGDTDGATTNQTHILQFLINNNLGIPKFIITTYHSCHLFIHNDISFCFKIGDEAHHLVGAERDETKGFRIFHKIKSNKSLFMTATEKIIEPTTKFVYSMDDSTVFGKLIDSKSVCWAIENKKITDYHILVLKNTEQEIDNIIARLGICIFNKEIFISCYMCVKTFEMYSNLTHILLYANTTDDAELSKTYIDMLLNLNIVTIPKENIYNNALHSKTKNNTDEITKFELSPFGIVSCVHLFSEGFNLPKLNAVCVCGNMQSEIRIIQYLLRPNRLEYGNPEKKAYIIIPYIDSGDWETKHKSYEKLRNVILCMRIEDQTIEQKITVCTIINPSPTNPDRRDTTEHRCDQYRFEENKNELELIKIKLRYSRALKFNYSEEQAEYNYVRAINQQLRISSKEEYTTLQNIHEHYIDSPDLYFRQKGVWNGWYPFMGTDTSGFIQTLQDWKKYCKEKNIDSLTSYKNACEIYHGLPKNPSEFYPKFSNIEIELCFTSSR